MIPALQAPRTPIIFFLIVPVFLILLARKFEMAEVSMADYMYKEPSLSYKTLTIIIIILLMISIIFGSFLVAPKIGYILFFLAVIGLIVLFIIFHNKHTAYICKSCGHEFEINFWKDLITAHSPGKKLLTCPQCSYKDYASEVIKGNNEK